MPVANGQADLSRSFKDGFDVKAISQVCQSVSPRLSTCQVKPKYPFFNCNWAEVLAVKLLPRQSVAHLSVHTLAWVRRQRHWYVLHIKKTSWSKKFRDLQTDGFLLPRRLSFLLALSQVHEHSVSWHHFSAFFRILDHPQITTASLDANLQKTNWTQASWPGAHAENKQRVRECEVKTWKTRSDSPMATPHCTMSCGPQWLRNSFRNWRGRMTMANSSSSSSSSSRPPKAESCCCDRLCIKSPRA